MQNRIRLRDLMRVEIRHIPFVETQRVVWFQDVPHSAVDVFYAMRVAAMSLLDALEYFASPGKMGKVSPNYNISHPEESIDAFARTQVGGVGHLPPFSFQSLSLQKDKLKPKIVSGVLLRFSTGEHHSHIFNTLLGVDAMEDICGCIDDVTDDTECEMTQLMMDQFQDFVHLFETKEQ